MTTTGLTYLPSVISHVRRHPGITTPDIVADLRQGRPGRHIREAVTLAVRRGLIVRVPATQVRDEYRVTREGQVTGTQQVTRRIYRLWDAATLQTRGLVPPGTPAPVPLGPADTRNLLSGPTTSPDTWQVTPAAAGGEDEAHPGAVLAAAACLTLAHVKILAAVTASPGITASEAIRRARGSRTRMSRATPVTHLIDHGLLERRGDTRTWLLYPSPGGESVTAWWMSTIHHGDQHGRTRAAVVPRPRARAAAVAARAGALARRRQLAAGHVAAHPLQSAWEAAVILNARHPERAARTWQIDAAAARRGLGLPVTAADLNAARRDPSLLPERFRVPGADLGWETLRLPGYRMQAGIEARAAERRAALAAGADLAELDAAAAQF